MDAEDTASEAAFRAELRDWLETSLPKLPWPEPTDIVEKVLFWRQWQTMLHEAGYAGLSWPEEYGGAGANVIEQAIFSQEVDLAGAPGKLNSIGEDFAGPTIIAFGTDEQKQRFLAKILRGEEIWCQLFSEPDAGSDLASLRTIAERVDGGWRVTGQKVWTSRAQISHHAILLARTGGGDRHRGISYFLLPMDSDGVSIRPLPQMLGEEEFNEVFLDGVFVPDDLLVGEVDGGWKVAMGTLGFERAAIATGRINTQRTIRDLIDLVRSSHDAEGRPLGEDPLVRHEVAELYGRAVMHHLTTQRVITGVAEGRPPGPESSVGKLFFCPLVEELADLALSLHQLGGQLESGDEPHSPWLRLAYQARGTSIAGGTTFIQRNIVAERVLGMPKGPR